LSGNLKPFLHSKKGVKGSGNNTSSEQFAIDTSLFHRTNRLSVGNLVDIPGRGFVLFSYLPIDFLLLGKYKIE